MNNIKTTILMVIIGLFLPYSGHASGNSEPSPQTATEAIFYLEGYLEAFCDISNSLNLPPNQRHSFRDMARLNYLQGFLFWQMGHNVSAFLLWGRATAFELAAVEEEEKEKGERGEETYALCKE